MALLSVQAMLLEQITAAFDDDDRFYEIKYDGFRGLAYVEDGKCSLVSRNDNVYGRFSNLSQQLPREIEADNAILDGEIVCLGLDGRAKFYDLMFNRAEPVFAAFDILYLNGEDLRDEPLWYRKSLLEGVVVQPPERVMYVQHIEGSGKALFEAMCDMDVEGIVAKPKISPYRTVRGKTTWFKIKNPEYSQAEGRRELFNQR